MKSVLTNKALSGRPSGGALNKALLTGSPSSKFIREGVVALPSCIALNARSKNLDGARKFVEFSKGQKAMQDGDDVDFYFVPIIDGVR